MAPGATTSFANDDLEDYGVDDFDDPFAGLLSGDEGTNNNNNKNSTDQSKKRKDIGIDEVVAVKKKARIPNVKLDETRLLSEKGIPRLRRKAGDLKFKGKGHEFSDTARLLSLYQLWLDDLFPKAKFLDALAMVEKVGHKGNMRLARMAWIDEGKPKNHQADDNDVDDLFGEAAGEEGRDATKFPSRIAPIFQNNASTSARPTTPDVGDVPDEDDIYDATPRAARRDQASAATTSLFGNGEPDDDEDLDALMAEEEARRAAPTSIFGSGQPSRPIPHRRQQEEPDEDDLDALMAEAEAEETAKSGPSTQAPKPVQSKPNQPAQDDEEDDLDALIAEAEAQESSSKPASMSTAPQNPSPTELTDADEEAAMAEMDGLW
ncbi:replication fork protection component Swi3-domain-containing protein [Xylariales sp. PMI_506]|nr:replication fork protection component Swi3-domain-containing protein [Xylariales sp. PMI_506]